mgnify:CR=1 FL=1
MRTAQAAANKKETVMPSRTLTARPRAAKPEPEIVEAADGSAVVSGVVVGIRYEGDDEVERHGPLLLGGIRAIMNAPL